MVLVKLWPRLTQAKFLVLGYGAVSERIKIDKIRQMYEKIDCHANSYYFFQLLNQEFCDNLHLGGYKGVIYFYYIFWAKYDVKFEAVL